MFGKVRVLRIRTLSQTLGIEKVEPRTDDIWVRTMPKRFWGIGLFLSFNEVPPGIVLQATNLLIVVF